MKPVKIKIDPKNRKAHVDSILEYLRSNGYWIECKSGCHELGFYNDNVVGIFGSTMGYVTYTHNEQAYDLSGGEEIFIDQPWTPQNGEKIEVSDGGGWTKAIFIGMDNGVCIAHEKIYGYSGWSKYRQISQIQQEIDQLEARLAELKAKL